MPKRNFDDAVKVKSPCSESWDEMTGNDLIKFCSHCAKDVNDVSKLTRREAMRLVRRSKGGLCVRYEVHPVTRRPVFMTRAGAVARRAGIAAGVIAASIAMAEAAYAQGGAMPLETVRVEQTEKTGATGASLSGYVTDSAGAAIPFAVVSISNVGTYEHRAVNASAEGFYEFKDLAAGTYTIKVEAGGFDAKQMENVQLIEATTVRRDARLDVQQLSATVEVKDEEMGESVIVGLIEVSRVPGVEPNALVSAVMDEDAEEVENLIRLGRKLNARDKTREGMTPLHAAIETGNIEIMQLLLAYGAKPNSRDFQKRTPLMVMDEDTEQEMVRLMLAWGADIRLVDAEKNTVLHHFAQFDEPEMMSYLIGQGADPNARNKAGRTPLMVAAENDNTAAMRALLENGADVRAVTKKKKQSAWDLAAGDAARELLLTYGASVSMH